MHSRRDESVQSQLFYSGIRIYSEEVFVEGRVHSDDVLDLVIHL